MSYLNNIEPMQLDASIDDAEGFETNESVPVNPESLTHQVDSSPFEVESYSAQYSGHAKLSRLLYIADHCPPMKIDALEIALNFVKESTFNINAYMLIHGKLLDALTSAGQQDKLEALDNNWIERTSNMSHLYYEKLDNDLKNYKTNSIKESIRRGHDEIANYYLSCGDLSNALKYFSRSRDYCMGEQQMFAVCLNVIKISIYMNNWIHVSSFIQKAESSSEFNTNQSFQSKVTCAAGLCELVNERYKSSAKRFIAANIDDINQGFSEIMSPNNIAVYGGLCALASFDRTELHKNVLSSPTFKLFLELEPTLREAIHKFYESKYPICLSLLDELKDAFLLDIFLAPHVNSLYSSIRSRALIQYFSPYISADLRLMAVAFNTDTNSLEEELMKLILDGSIQARIDSHNKILYAKDTDARLCTFEKVLDMGIQWQMKTSAMILRAACIRNGQIHVKPHSSSNKAEESSSNICSPSSPCKSRN